MPDVVDTATRSRMMAGIRGKNTKPELIVRSGLHRLGYRFRLHDRRLPGKPDLILHKHHAAVLVHGCFWHLHGCHLFKWPKSRVDFWRDKISGNAARDQQNIDNLRAGGWRVAIVWECALKGRDEAYVERVIQGLADWLLSDADRFETIVE